MCGIAGIINFDKQPVRLEQLTAMTDRMIHRGPDDEGFYVSDSIGLGFRRLSIIDVAGGRQPLSNEDGCLQLVFNGEIYNYIELRRQLIYRGHVFRTQSDAEVLLHQYEEQGVHALSELNGMFAFALWDSRKHALWLGRDRLGIKPLFYTTSANQIIFASDVRALRAVYPTDIDKKAILKYMALSYTPQPETVWRGIIKLAPAHYLWIENNGDIQCQRYWSVDKTRTWRGSEDEAGEQLDSLLADAVKLQMRSDVPIGVLLSGGLDSSTIVSYAAQLTSEPLRTITIECDGKEASDGKYAREVATRHATNHVAINMSEVDALNGINALLTIMDEPLSDSAILPAYLVSRAAQERGIKVLLSGAGGDEIFGGYRRHWKPRLGSPAWVATLPAPVRQLVARAWSLLQPDRGVRASNPIYAWASGISGVSLHTCRLLLRNLDDYHILTMAIKDEYSELVESGQSNSYAYLRMTNDLQKYLPEDVLSLTDKATMAASVEGRVPLLDHRLVEFAFSLPEDVNLLGNTSKGLLKKVMGHRLSEKLLNRKKEGFNAPITEWMQRSSTLNVADELMNHRTSIVDELFDAQILERILKNPVGWQSASETLFALFLFNRWYRVQTAL